MSLRTTSRLFAIVIFIARLTAAQTISTETATRIDALLARTITDQHIPAISVAVAVNGQMQYQKAFGKADLENDIAGHSRNFVPHRVDRQIDDGRRGAALGR